MITEIIVIGIMLVYSGAMYLVGYTHGREDSQESVESDTDNAAFDGQRVSKGMRRDD